MSEDWRFAVTVPLYKSKGKRTECVVGKIYAGILVVRVLRVTVGLIDDERGGFRVWRGCADQSFTLKQIGEKKRSVCGFYRFGGGV